MLECLRPWPWVLMWWRIVHAGSVAAAATFLHALLAPSADAVRVILYAPDLRARTYFGISYWSYGPYVRVLSK